MPEDDNDELKGPWFRNQRRLSIPPPPRRKPGPTVMTEDEEVATASRVQRLKLWLRSWRDLLLPKVPPDRR